MNRDPQAETIRRLHCAAGHLNAVIEMAESGQPCEQVLHQLNAVQSALRAAGLKIIHSQAQTSQAVILNSSSCEERIAELKRLQSLYRVFTQHSFQTLKVTYD